MTRLNLSNEQFWAPLTVHLVLSADFNQLSFLDIQEEVGCLFSSKMAEINFIYLKKTRQSC